MDSALVLDSSRLLAGTPGHCDNVFFSGVSATALCGRSSNRRPRPILGSNGRCLENAFFQVASASGKPRGLRWKECQWDNQLEWLREKRTGQLWALAGVTISFEAIEGGDMEGVAAVGDLRNGTAVFFYQDDRWQTAGRAVFNLTPAEAVDHFRADFERVLTSGH